MLQRFLERSAVLTVAFLLSLGVSAAVKPVSFVVTEAAKIGAPETLSEFILRELVGKTRNFATQNAVAIIKTVEGAECNPCGYFALSFFEALEIGSPSARLPSYWERFSLRPEREFVKTMGSYVKRDLVINKFKPGTETENAEWLKTNLDSGEHGTFTFDAVIRRDSGVTTESHTVNVVKVGNEVYVYDLGAGGGAQEVTSFMANGIDREGVSYTVGSSSDFALTQTLRTGKNYRFDSSGGIGVSRGTDIFAVASTDSSASTSGRDLLSALDVRVRYLGRGSGSNCTIL